MLYLWSRAETLSNSGTKWGSQTRIGKSPLKNTRIMKQFNSVIVTVLFAVLECTALFGQWSLCPGQMHGESQQLNLARSLKFGERNLGYYCELTLTPPSCPGAKDGSIKYSGLTIAALDGEEVPAQIRAENFRVTLIGGSVVIAMTPESRPNGGIFQNLPGGR